MANCAKGSGKCLIALVKHWRNSPLLVVGSQAASVFSSTQADVQSTTSRKVPSLQYRIFGPSPNEFGGNIENPTGPAYETIGEIQEEKIKALETELEELKKGKPIFSILLFALLIDSRPKNWNQETRL